MGWIEGGDGQAEIGFEWEVLVADALHDRSGQLVGAVGVEVRVVFELVGLVGECVGWVVDEGMQGSGWAHGFEEGFAEGIEVDEG